jgi:hypothetical protein
VEALGTSEFVSRRYLHITLEKLEQLSENRTKPVSTSTLMAEKTRAKQALTSDTFSPPWRKPVSCATGYGAGLPEDGSWEMT